MAMEPHHIRELLFGTFSRNFEPAFRITLLNMQNAPAKMKVAKGFLDLILNNMLRAISVLYARDCASIRDPERLVVSESRVNDSIDVT